jgi:hypothetical protein
MLDRARAGVANRYRTISAGLRRRYGSGRPDRARAAAGRRRVLQTLMIAVGLASLDRHAWGFGDDADGCAWITDLFSNPAAAQSLGRLYLASHAEEADSGFLTAMLFGLPHGQPWAGGAEGARRHLALEQRRDFAESRIAVVDGWILSRTEARICALVACLRASGC